jgi:site-specific DNA-methyltransferase (adenine-specific)
VTHQGDGWTLHVGDCLDVMAGMADESVDSIVTDPPYGLSFMGKHWDHGIPDVDFWLQALRVAKPGTHMLAFGGTRTYHRLTCAIEDAGWEIRDCIMWVYGSGFPKSHDVSKAIDKEAGAVREVTRAGVVQRDGYGGWDTGSSHTRPRYDLPATPLAARWQGWGTALKPAWEPIIVARKPLAGTVAANVTRYGTGALNIDGCRVGSTVETWPTSKSYAPGQFQPGGKGDTQTTGAAPAGRWPANLIHDGSEEATAGMGKAARYFYCAKASKRDRDEGCEGFDKRIAPCHNIDGRNPENPKNYIGQTPMPLKRNNHPTVKPTDLMRYLCRLVTPPGGIVLDPFAGSGSTGKAALLGGFRFVGIEKEPDYAEIAVARLTHAAGKAGLFGAAP